MVPTVDKPTRVHRSSTSLIDNIFVNSLEFRIVSGNIVSDISDHFSQFCIISSDHQSSKLQKQKIRNFSNFKETKFFSELSQINWSSLVAQEDINLAFNKFYNKVNKVVNKHAPFTKISKRSINCLKKPWITQDIRRSIKHKNRLFYSGDYSEYKQYRNKLLSITRLSKKNHFHAYFELNISNMKKTWQGINNLIYGKKKSRKSISCIRTCSSNNENGTLVSNPKEIPDVLNSYFSNIGANLANNIPQITKTYKDYLKQPTVN